MENIQERNERKRFRTRERKADRKGTLKTRGGTKRDDKERDTITKRKNKIRGVWAIKLLLTMLQCCADKGVCSKIMQLHSSMGQLQVGGGLQFFATDTLDANGLIDAFSAMQAGTGYEADQTVQLESTGATLAKSQCLNGTVFIDKTIGNDTFFLVTWQTAVPSIDLRDPTGVIYTTLNFTTDTTTKSHRLQIPGTAKTGAWHYSLCSTVTASQAVGITVTSKAANESVPPITVSAHMDTDTNAYPKPMVVYAAVRQGLLPVINAKVTAIIEPTTGPTISFELLDNGAGPDIIKNDGIYSKYFTSFTVNGRYNLKVNVTSNDNKGRLVLPQNRALYMPGYVENGAVIMNPSRPVADEEELNLGSFSRSASGGSFSVTNVPSGPLKDIYKPEKITDLVAKIAEDKIVLSWTATGDDLDQGNATSYDLRLSTNPRDLRDNFFSSVLVDVSSVKPLPAGYSETFTFKPENITIQNGTILYFALIAVDEVDQKSDVSNVAQAALFIPPTPEPTTPAPTEVPRPVPTEVPTGAPTNAPEKDNINVTVVTIIVCVAAVVITLIIGITVCIVCRLKNLHKAFSSGNNTQVKLINGGYEDIVFAINPGIIEDVKIIDGIKALVKEATGYLFHATKNRLFIRSVKILIPITWDKKGYSKVKTETYNKADVIIAKPHLKNRNDPYTLQYGQCGETGRYIHFTPEFLVDDTLINVYGPRGRVFVHEWAHFRWGVYDEYNTDTPYYISNKPAIEATRCPAELKGVYRKENCNGNNCNCIPDPDTGLYDKSCVFLPDKNQASNTSIMYLQALNDVYEFCDARNHNTEAPNLQNRMCNYRSTWDVIMDSEDIRSTPQATSITIPEPIVTVMQVSDRVVTLVLDVSGSMATYNRIGRLYQAADVFLIQIIEQGSYVGIVQFHSSALVRSPLLQIVTENHRQQLKALLPTTANGGTNICSGILKGLEVNRGLNDKSSYGTEIVLLSDGEDNDASFPSACYAEIINSGAIIHVIALGPNAAKPLENITQSTGGLNFYASDSLDANGLIDAFSSLQAGTGYEIDQTIQLESTGATLAKSQCLNGTIFIDKTIGNDTFFLVTWQTGVPSIELQDPTGVIYTTSSFSTDTTTKSSRLQIPGTAKTGAWHYSLCNPLTSSQVVGITVTSKAVNESVPPITVSAHMDTDTNAYPKPMVVYAAVRQGLLPVINAKVTAIIEPTTGPTISFELLDNGAGPDIIKNDGIYSKYFTKFSVNGRYSLKVQVESKDNKARLVLPQNRALYIPGYVENGAVVMNPPRPVSSEEELNVGSFSRTASGGSFVVSAVPPGVLPDIYKPEKITDLVAKISEDKIVLTWTATGDDLDQGNATSYDLRMSTNPRDLRDNFSSSVLVDVSSIKPLPAGSSETFTFQPENITIQNGTILYFALIAVDKVDQKSDVSNVAQAALFIPPTPEPTTSAPTEVPTGAPTEVPTGAPTNAPAKDNVDITLLTIIVCSAVIVICIIISITICIVSGMRKKRNPELRL
ncbi:calcium-activated chloride channel regulator 1-like [Gastrophryne carolinensis]